MMVVGGGDGLIHMYSVDLCIACIDMYAVRVYNGSDGSMGSADSKRVARTVEIEFCIFMLN